MAADAVAPGGAIDCPARPVGVESVRLRLGSRCGMAARRLRGLPAHGALAVVVAAALLSAGCATVPPPTAPPLEGWFALLPPAAGLYLSIAVKAERPLVKQILVEASVNEGAVGELIDRTERIYLSAGWSDRGLPAASVSKGAGADGAHPGAPPRFEAVAIGSFPRGLIDFRVGASGQWKRERFSGQPAGGSSSTIDGWWQSRSSRLQLAVPNERIALVSDGGMRGMAARLAGAYTHPIPSEALARIDAATFGLYLPHPALLLASPFSLVENVPAEALLVTMSPKVRSTNDSGARWDIGAWLTTPSERDARALGVTVKLLIASQGGDAGLMPALPLPLAQARVEVRGRTIELSGMSLDSDRMSELLSAFLRRAGVGEMFE